MAVGLGSPAPLRNLLQAEIRIEERTPTAVISAGCEP